MGLSDDSEKDILKLHQELCKALNLDKASANEAWKHFSKVYDSYILDGDPMHWLGCAIYVASRRVAVPTVGKSSILVQGNLVNLSRLLKHINLSLVEFFSKIKKWTEHTKLPEEFIARFDQLERNFRVSLFIFKKFQPIIIDLFGDPALESVKLMKSKKYKSQPANIWRIFEFTWTLFVCVKSQYPKISDDLVSSLHLLLACCDFIFVNALMSGRRDIANPSFPEINIMGKYSDLSEVPCIIDHLCERHDGTTVEAKAIKQYRWRRYIKQLFSTKVLRGNSHLLSDVLESNNFEFNLKNINRNYEEYVLSAGEFDERIFLGDFKKTFNTHAGGEEKSLIGCAVTSNCGTMNSYSLQQKGNLIENFDLKQALHFSNNKGLPMTPLTARKYLQPKTVTYEAGPGQIVATLQTMLCGKEPVPSETFLKLIRSCDAAPNVEQLIRQLIENTKEKLVQQTDGLELVTTDNANVCCDLAKRLFFKLMDTILASEVEKSSFDANLLLSQEVFHKTLFSCVMQIILFSCDDIRPFPWILIVNGLTPYHFYRIIEIVVRTETVLTREIVKHLNSIEETILECLAWAHDSPLWKGIIDSGLPVPYCEDVCTQPVFGDIEDFVGRQTSKNVDKLTFLAGKESSLAHSPGGPLFEKFLSPKPLSGLKRSLDDSPDKTNFSKCCHSDSPLPSKVIITQKNGETSITTQSWDSNKQLKENKKPKRTGAVALFFRKFYYLASVRMEDMCNQLGLIDKELRLKIWTCFELSIVNYVGLMLDRHLDQILMCAVYVICKIVGPEKTFTEVMKCYRNQPQAQSCVYRNVLVSPNRTLDDLKKYENALSEDEKRGDLIKFYNTVYVKNVQNMVLRFKEENPGGYRVVLSPLPISKSVALNSPRRVSEKHSVFLRALGQDKSNSSSPKQLSYCFSQSPAKDLLAINNMVKCDAFRIGKKLLRDDDNEMQNCETNSGVITRKVQGLHVDRLAAKAQ